MPRACRAILIVTLGVFLIQLILNYAIGKQAYADHVMGTFGLVPADIFSRRLRLWQLVSYIFLHALDNPLHILFNMFIFAMFSPDVERAMAARRFLLLYFISGVCGGLLQCAVDPSSAVPTIGASASVLGVLAAYGSLFPKRVVYMFLVFPMKAKHAVFLLAAVELLSAVMGNPHTDAVAYFAHLGGFMAGFLFVRYEWTVRGMVLRSIQRHYIRELESDRQIRERVDDLLDKVSREGVSSLTWRERVFLKRASKRFKKQRTRLEDSRRR